MVRGQAIHCFSHHLCWLLAILAASSADLVHKIIASSMNVMNRLEASSSKPTWAKSCWRIDGDFLFSKRKLSIQESTFRICLLLSEVAY